MAQVVCFDAWAVNAGGGLRRPGGLREPLTQLVFVIPWYSWRRLPQLTCKQASGLLPEQRACQLQWSYVLHRSCLVMPCGIPTWALCRLRGYYIPWDYTLCCSQLVNPMELLHSPVAQVLREHACALWDCCLRFMLQSASKPQWSYFTHLLHRSCVSMPCAAGRKKPRLCRMLTPQLNTSCSRVHRTDRRGGKDQQGATEEGTRRLMTQHLALLGKGE